MLPLLFTQIQNIQTFFTDMRLNQPTTLTSLPSQVFGISIPIFLLLPYTKCPASYSPTAMRRDMWLFHQYFPLTFLPFFWRWTISITEVAVALLGVDKFKRWYSAIKLYKNVRDSSVSLCFSRDVCDINITVIKRNWCHCYCVTHKFITIASMLGSYMFIIPLF